jgi:hypothetical protein
VAPGPLALLHLGQTEGFPSLLPSSPLAIPPPPQAKFLKRAGGGLAARAAGASAARTGPAGGAGGEGWGLRDGDALARVPALPRNHSCFPPGPERSAPAPRVPAFVWPGFRVRDYAAGAAVATQAAGAAARELGARPSLLTFRSPA